MKTLGDKIEKEDIKYPTIVKVNVPSTDRFISQDKYNKRLKMRFNFSPSRLQNKLNLRLSPPDPENTINSIIRAPGSNSDYLMFKNRLHHGTIKNKR